jgi:putative membrane protein
MMYGDGWGAGWGMWMWIVFIPLIIFGLYLLFRNNSQNQNQAKNQSPIDILKIRYTKGEITKEQFEEMKKDLY